MTAAARPQRPVLLSDPVDRAELDALVEALFEEARRRAQWRRRRNGGIALLAAILAVGAYYGIVRGNDGGSAAGAPLRSGPAATHSTVHNGALAIFNPPPNGPIAPGNIATIETVSAAGSKTIWRCPRREWCGQAVSHAWSPDGRHLALSLDEIGGTSGYVGLHVIDTATGRDRQIPSGAPKDLHDPGSRAYFQKLSPRLGCWPPSQLAWSPDGTKLAYPCGTGTAQTQGGRQFISILEVNGSGYTAIPATAAASWPSWSPDGKWIVYATGIRPKDHPSVYIVRLDGTDRRRIAKDGTAPAWSPDGRSIAYQTACGIQLATPAGTNITPPSTANSCGAIGRSGPPVWSPDGKKIAFETQDGIYAMNTNGRRLHLVSHKTTTTWYGQLPGRPAWRPTP